MGHAQICPMERPKTKICVHVPMVDHTNGFNAVNFVNAPFKTKSGESVTFKSQSGLLAMRGVLDQDKEYSFVPDEGYEKTCTNILAQTVCMGTVHREIDDSCAASLYSLNFEV